MELTLQYSCEGKCFSATCIQVAEMLETADKGCDHLKCSEKLSSEPTIYIMQITELLLMSTMTNIFISQREKSAACEIPMFRSPLRATKENENLPISLHTQRGSSSHLQTGLQPKMNVQACKIKFSKAHKHKLNFHPKLTIFTYFADLGL